MGSWTVEFLQDYYKASKGDVEWSRAKGEHYYWKQKVYSLEENITNDGQSDSDQRQD